MYVCISEAQLVSRLFRKELPCVSSISRVKIRYDDGSSELQRFPGNIYETNSTTS